MLKIVYFPDIGNASLEAAGIIHFLVATNDFKPLEVSFPLENKYFLFYLKIYIHESMSVKLN